MSAEIEVQRALFLALSGLGLTVVDVAPQRPDDGSFPYVAVGAIVLAPWDDKGSQGFDLVARIHTRSRSAGMAQAKGIQGQIYARLHNGDLTIVGQRLVLLQRQMSEVTRATDGSFHGVCEYRGLIETL
jgi:hypothetical protein